MYDVIITIIYVKLSVQFQSCLQEASAFHVYIVKRTNQNRLIVLRQLYALNDGLLTLAFDHHRIPNVDGERTCIFSRKKDRWMKEKTNIRCRSNCAVTIYVETLGIINR